MPAFVLALILVGAGLGLAAQARPGSAPGEARQQADLIVLDVAAPDAPELPPVPFAHDRHTKAVLAVGGSCASCHNDFAEGVPATSEPAEPGGSGKHISFAFKGLADAPADASVAAMQRFFHEGCFSCHEGMKKKGLSSGPTEAECRSCHTGAPRGWAQEARTDGGLDPGLHFRHIDSPVMLEAAEYRAQGDSLSQGLSPVCAGCHHPVEQFSSPELAADSCRSCHHAGPEPGVPFAGVGFDQVAHESCLPCHLSLAAASKATGPVECAGCHDEARKAAYSRPATRPRLLVGQPDAVLLAADDPAGSRISSAEGPAAGISPVAFNHALHEQAVADCASCHHMTLASCSSCHESPANPRDGGEEASPEPFVVKSSLSLMAALHDPASTASCVGCHAQTAVRETECAGCHATLPVAASPECSFCHTAFKQPLAPGRSEAGVAADLVKARAEQPKMPDLTAVPETVEIGSLAQAYAPAIMPHRAIIEALAKGIAEKAPGFGPLHAQRVTGVPGAAGASQLCASCHHNSPLSANPPACASCHAEEPFKASPSRGGFLPQPERTARPSKLPPLKVAYHQQCMGCHQRMDISAPADTDCEACHAAIGPAS